MATQLVLLLVSLLNYRVSFPLYFYDYTTTIRTAIGILHVDQTKHVKLNNMRIIQDATS
jgi:hypothetical protein